MNRLRLLLACCISVFLAGTLHSARSKTPAATVILLDGELQYFERGVRHKLDLGQSIGSDSQFDTAKGASVHLVLANGSSLILAPNSSLKLETLDLPPARPRYRAKLLLGQVAVLADAEDQAMSFELSATTAALSFKKARFELAVIDGGATVTVDRGSVEFGDGERKRTETVGALRSCSLFKDRLERPNRLSKRDAGAFRQRWERSQMIHGQRKELLKNLRSLR